MSKRFEDIFPPKDVKEAVFAVLAFFDIFDCPLTKDEILRFIMLSGEGTKYIDNFLKDSNRISTVDGFFFIKGRDSIVNKRIKNKKIAMAYMAKVNKYVPLLKYIPFIRAVAVCNTLAIDCPDEQSDIDLFIITDPRRVNLARLFSTILFHVLGIRRHYGKIAARFCLSFYVANDGLNFDAIKSEEHDIYLFYWAYTLKPIFGEEYFNKFWSENEDLIKYFKYKTRTISNKGRGKFRINPIELIFGGKIGDYFEKIILGVHKKRFEKRLSSLPEHHGIVIDDKMLKFHNRDMRKAFNSRFRERYLALLA